jgi:hypothetical protein
MNCQVDAMAQLFGAEYVYASIIPLIDVMPVNVAETWSEQVPCGTLGCRVTCITESLETIPATIPLLLSAVLAKTVDHVPVSIFSD